MPTILRKKIKGTWMQVDAISIHLVSISETGIQVRASIHCGAASFEVDNMREIFISKGGSIRICASKVFKMKQKLEL